MSDGPLLDLIKPVWLLATSASMVSGERASCEDPHPLDGYEGWSSSGLTAHHSDDLAASGCLERNPKLGPYQEISAHKNISKHIDSCQGVSAFVRTIKSDRNISKDQTISKHIKTNQTQ